LNNTKNAKTKQSLNLNKDSDINQDIDPNDAVSDISSHFDSRGI
jgi:hypothetical protein